mgnify:CR=1 FL=1
MRFWLIETRTGTADPAIWPVTRHRSRIDGDAASMTPYGCAGKLYDNPCIVDCRSATPCPLWSRDVHRTRATALACGRNIWRSTTRVEIYLSTTEPGIGRIPRERSLIGGRNENGVYGGLARSSATCGLDRQLDRRAIPLPGACRTRYESSITCAIPQAITVWDLHARSFAHPTEQRLACLCLSTGRIAATTIAWSVAGSQSLCGVLHMTIAADSMVLSRRARGDRRRATPPECGGGRHANGRVHTFANAATTTPRSRFVGRDNTGQARPEAEQSHSPRSGIFATFLGNSTIT